MKQKPKIDFSPAEHIRNASPQAIFWRPIKYFSEHIRNGHDDLDSYKAASFISGNNLTFELRCYYGHPQHTTTLYLSHGTDDNEIQEIIDLIIIGMDIPLRALAWRRGWEFKFGELDAPPTDRLLEAEARILVLKIVGSCKNRVAPTSYIKKTLPEFTTLSSKDNEQSKSRRNEKLWQQIVGNVVSHKEGGRSIFSMGYAYPIDGKIALTADGILYLKSIGFLSLKD